MRSTDGTNTAAFLHSTVQKEAVFPVNENVPEPEGSGLTGGDNLLRKEQELLAKARETAQRITERVRKTLTDTEGHESLPTEEKPPLS